ncbi:MAG: efflux transporter outer membrane subunit [Desulfovibrio sp.]|jgi:multidrug efflux system outer membrane protein|nr:efflux transporter outer membrane subunit [Desulfovibrio sp.]
MASFVIRIFRQALCALIPLVMLLAGCTMAPKYERPGLPTPNAYDKGAGLFGGPAPFIAWRGFFTDPGTQRLIETALTNNRDLRAAMLNVEKVRAQYRIQRADILPTAAAMGESSNRGLPAGISGLPKRAVVRQHTVSVGATNFELDLFGRIRSLTDAALETYYSTEDDVKTAQITLVAEVAAVYLQMIADKELLDITAATCKNRKGQYELVRNKFTSGVASQLEVSQAKSIMEEARSNVARYATRVGQDENYLALLIGAPLPKDLPDVRKLSRIRMLADIPEGLPSSLLERRPDIQASEHRLKAAYANIGAARANFFPTINLTGGFGAISADASELFEGSTGFWQFLPSVSLPIFDTGRNISRLDVAESERKMAVTEYEKTIQEAFREVADCLVQRQYIGSQMDAERELLKSTTESYNLASARYDVGVDSYLNVLDAQRSLYSAQQSYISTMLLRETNALTLYKALGGGWDIAPGR